MKNRNANGRLAIKENVTEFNNNGRITAFKSVTLFSTAGENRIEYIEQGGKVRVVKTVDNF